MLPTTTNISSTTVTSIAGVFSNDIVFLLAAFVIIFLAIIYLNKTRFISFILAFYPASLLYNNFPFMNQVVKLTGEKGIALNKFVIFLAFFILINIIINKHLTSYDVSPNNLSKAGLAIAVLILIPLFSFMVVNLSPFHPFSDTIVTLFSGGTKLFLWSLVPLLLLLFV